MTTAQTWTRWDLLAPRADVFDPTEHHPDCTQADDHPGDCLDV